jgi:hypothetical protein
MISLLRKLFTTLFVTFPKFLSTLLFNQYLLTLFTKLRKSVVSDLSSFKRANKVLMLYKIYSKVLLTILYGLVFFIMHTQLGVFLVYLCGSISTVCAREFSEPTVIYLFCKYYFWGSFAILVNFWLLMQFETPRKLLLEIISLEEFATYLGLNPASEVKKFFTSTYAIILGGSFLQNYVSKWIDRDHTSKTLKGMFDAEKKNRAHLPKEHPVHQQPLVPPQVIYETLNTKQPGFLDVFTEWVNPEQKGGVKGV